MVPFEVAVQATLMMVSLFLVGLGCGLLIAHVAHGGKIRAPSLYRAPQPPKVIEAKPLTQAYLEDVGDPPPARKSAPNKPAPFVGFEEDIALAEAWQAEMAKNRELAEIGQETEWIHQ